MEMTRDRTGGAPSEGSGSSGTPSNRYPTAKTGSGVGSDPSFGFFNHPQLLELLDSAKSVPQADLVNKINYLHFNEGSVLVHLRHPRYEDDYLLTATPEPCTGDLLTCRFSGATLDLISRYTCGHLLVPSEALLVAVPARLEEMDENRLVFRLPAEGRAVNARQARRYKSHGIDAEVFQNAFLGRGELADFSPSGIRIVFREDCLSSFTWFNPEARVTIRLYKGRQSLLLSQCTCIRFENTRWERSIVLAPPDDETAQFKKKKVRNPRQQLVPSFSISFEHPLLGKRLQREVLDISTSGFSVLEDAGSGTLLPGMIIPELTLNFAGALEMRCSTNQVIYRLEHPNGKIRCGLAILDMDIKTYTHLTNILANALDPHAHICFEVDLEELWKFFFDTGFIYPKKYGYISSRLQDFKKTYQRLYKENPEIARHFTYQKSERIYGHVSLVRAYESTWMFHHLAARPLENSVSGLMVLKHITHFANELHRLPSAKMEYMICYFRPENRFPNLFFGGYARALDRPRSCSLDLFSYMLLPRADGTGSVLPEGWLLREFRATDLWELSQFYRHHSGGLLLDVLRPGHEEEQEPLEAIYRRLGFVRSWRCYSLLRHGGLQAVLVVDQSDLGFNLSDLLNCIKVLVTEPEALPWDVLATAIEKVSDVYQTDRIPLLICPHDYVEKHPLPFEASRYHLWIMDATLGADFMEYTRRRFKVKYWE